MENKKGSEKQLIIDPKKVSHQGSLGLLALGYRGLIAWREARNEFAKKNNNVGGQDEKKG